MSGGADLLGQAPVEARRRGRPKGSTNKRAKDLRGLIDHRYGGSAALQAAQLALVTPAELRKAGGSMAAAMVAKAVDLVEHVRRAQGERDQAFRETIREEFERLLLDVRDVTAKELRQALDQCLKRVREAGAAFSLREAMELLARERAALLPYTDQRQPLAIEAKGQLAPSVVVMGAAPMYVAEVAGLENTEVFEGWCEEVSPAKSHDDGQGVDLPGLLAPRDTD